MYRKTILAVLMCCPLFAAAQSQSDPVVMSINGEPVLRSEFEYSYNKNNSEGVIDKKTVDEYVELFINYKLKVAAALDAKLDTASSFKKEFAQYRDLQIRPTFVTDDDVEREAKRIYDNTKQRIGPQGLIRPAHILLHVEQKASDEEHKAAKQRIDSIYAALKAGGDFAKMAEKYSQDPGSARNGGQLPWIGPGQTYPTFETAAYKLKVGEMSEPVESPAGFHIIYMKERKQLEPFDTLRSSILKFIEQRNIRDQIASANIDSLVAKSHGGLTIDQIMEKRADSLMATDSDLKNLIREYHDGLLLYEISNRTVWDKASKDEEGLEAFFKKNKKKYAWTEPRFKGIAYHVKTQDDVKAVKDCVKKLSFDKWNEALRSTFNPDSVIRIRAEKGIFKKGDNALVDREVFKKDTVVTATKDYPIDATFGKVLKKGPEDYTDVRGLVTADYQDALEKEWVADLRRKYSVTVNKEVLSTVNNHK
jgi:peptidyl-prolyl cis-trans isomerase SurA